jgi:hypothetical protein
LLQGSARPPLLFATSPHLFGIEKLGDFTYGDLAIRRAFEAAGVEFIDENGGGPGVRLRSRGKPRK